MSRPRLGGAGAGPEFVKGGDGGRGDGWHDYDFAVIRVLPHVHLETHVNVGVVLHSRGSGFLEARTVQDPRELADRAPGVDAELLAEYLTTFVGVARGDEGCGPMALLPPSERFHWLTAPRSDVIQCSRVHSGRSRDLGTTLGDLFRQYVGGTG
jgi:hypothetical protein